MPEVIFTIYNLSQKTSANSDRVYTTDGSNPWDPTTVYPGADATVKFGNEFSGKLYTNPSGTKEFSSLNCYFWDYDNLTGTSTPDYGVAVGLDGSNNIKIVNLIPGNITPDKGIGLRYIAVSASGYMIALDTIPITIKNDTGDTLPYFINTIQTQPNPIGLSDFTADNAKLTIAKDATLTTSVFNTNLTADLQNNNVGIYFFDNGAADTDTATAAILIDMTKNGSINVVGGSMIVTNSSYNFTVKNKDGSSNGDPANSKFKWVWIGIILGVVFLLIIIAFVVHYFMTTSKKDKEEPNKEHGYDDYDETLTSQK